MKIFVTGATGAIGKFLLPLLLENRHEVVALTRSPDKAEPLDKMGVSTVIADPLDKQQLTAAVRRAEPEVIIHQLTSLSGAGNFRKFDEEFALTNRFRTEVTDNLLAAARTIGTRRFIAQSYCGWPYAKKGGPVIYNVVDDEPAKVSTWLPAFAKAIGAKPPYKIPHWLGELIIGKEGVSIMTQIRGCSNAKAKRELNWTPIYPSWRVGFVDALG